MRLRQGIGRVACVVVSGWAIAACSVVTSLDGLTGGDATPGGSSEGGATLDAHVALGDASPVSDGAPASSPDTAIVDDAAAADDTIPTADDAGDAAPPVDAGHDAGATGFCATLPTPVVFCDDFDDGGPLKGPWDQVSSTNGGATIVSVASVSAPNAMGVATIGGSQQVDSAAYKSFSKITGSSPVTVTATFQLRVDKVDTTSNSDAVLAGIELYDGANDWWYIQLEVYWDSTKGALKVDFSEDGKPSDGGAEKYTDHWASQELPLNTWTKVTMSVTLQSPNAGYGPATAKLSFNDVAIASPTVSVPAYGPTPEMIAGVTYVNSGSAGWSLTFDDVTFDVK